MQGGHRAVAYRSHIVETRTESYRFKRSLARLKALKGFTLAEPLGAEKPPDARNEDDAMSNTSDSGASKTTRPGLHYSRLIVSMNVNHDARRWG